jgi:hypothetical protein
MSVSAALFIQHAQCMRRIILACVTCPALSHLSTLYHKGNDVRNTVIGHQMCVLPLQHLSGKFLILRRIQGRGVHRVLVGKPGGTRPLARPRRRLENNIKRDLQEVGRGCGDWMERAQDRNRWRALVSTVMSIRIP